jgi:hypothetical protein
MFRMVTTQTGATTGAFFQLGEIEFFGDETEPPVGPPTGCASCGSGVTDLTCQGGLAQDFAISWKNSCICVDTIKILVNGVEIATVAPDATSYTIPAASVPKDVFVVSVVNCSSVPGTCTLFRTTPDGSIIGTQWLALGPFATPVACDGNPSLFLTNHIGPQESINCQYPIAGDPIEGYVPGNPAVPDPAKASTSAYHALAPVDGLGNPVWRLFSDLTPKDGDLNFEQGPAGALDQQVQFVATWIENKTASAMDVKACIGRDDDAQVWLDDNVIYNRSTCSGRSLCQATFSFTLPPGVHVIKVGVWEEAGDWGLLFGLKDPVTELPIVDLGGILNGDDLTLASPLSADIVFHGTERPAGFVEPECSGVICLPITNLVCTKNRDGTIDLSWVNGEGCDNDIRISVGKNQVAVVGPDTTSYKIDAEKSRLATMVSVNNGSYDTASCSLVEARTTLLGNDLTDLGNDGVEANYSVLTGNLGGFDAKFFASDEATFNGTEAAFNVFDNVLGGGAAKWCCGTTFPQIVGADFTEAQGKAFRLSHFTVTSAEDAPDRDPRVWRIEGSDDGTTWTTIFSQDNPDAALWTARLQVLHFEEGREYELQTEAYFMFRMVTEKTNLPGGNATVAFFQLAEIEFFGEEESAPPETCDNGTDDDGDQLIDCKDPDCASAAYCQHETACADGIDNDADQKTDCADEDCASAANCLPETVCDDGIDNDGDQKTDCADEDCASAANCLPETACEDGIDNDGDQKTDCADTDCASAANCQLKKFYRADPNNDGTCNITDGIYILNFLFIGGPPPTCRESADANNDKAVNITDGIVVLNYLVLGGTAPASPGPPGKGEPCGPDTDEPGSAGDLGCETYTKC